jgi:Domain of unknown function (DUF4372)/Transposase DDE domain
MAKDNFFTGQPVFNQLLQLIPKHIIRDVSRQHQSNRYYKRFRTYEHLVTMLYTSFHGCKSLREVITGMMACTTRINHLGIDYIPRRSTLAEANANRPETVFGDLYHRLYAHFYPDSRLLTKLEKRLFIFDSTTISLFSEVMKGSGQIPAGRRKGGAKAHILMKADEDVPRFVCLTEAKENDNIFPPMINLPEHSIVTFDRIYYGFKPLIKWTHATVTWVTRMHPLVAYTVLKSKQIPPDQKQKGVIADEHIRAGALKRKDKMQARRIIYQDPVSGKELIFLTNNNRMKAITIANIYKQRWQIECLFKRLKQNYPLKYFLGETQNAIKIQIWCALITDLLIKIVKDKVKRKWAFSNIASIIRLHLMTYINLIKFLQNPEKALNGYCPPHYCYQPSLFPT